MKITAKLANEKLIGEKKLIDIQKEIDKRNEIFKNATPSEKRVLIAKDVIQQLKNKKFTPTTGCWVEPVFNSVTAKKLGTTTECLNDYVANAGSFNDYEMWDIDENNASTLNKLSVREAVLSNTITTCNVCALGAMFTSCTLYNNKTTIIDFTEGGEITKFQSLFSTNSKFKNGLNKYFDNEQLMLIESAYEGSNGMYFNRNTRYFMEEYPDNRKRMIAIMENIIKNNGEFVIEGVNE